MKSDLPKMLFTVGEVCQMMAISKHTLYRMMRDPHNPMHSIGEHKARRFTYREIERWIASEEAANGNGNAAA